MQVKIVGLDKTLVVREELMKSGVSLTSPINVAVALTSAINKQIAILEEKGEEVLSVSFVGSYEPVFVLNDTPVEVI